MAQSLVKNPFVRTSYGIVQSFYHQMSLQCCVSCALLQNDISADIGIAKCSAKEQCSRLVVHLGISSNSSQSVSLWVFKLRSQAVFSLSQFLACECVGHLSVKC